MELVLRNPEKQKKNWWSMNDELARHSGWRVGHGSIRDAKHARTFLAELCIYILLISDAYLL